MKQRVIVFGGSGFIGSHVIDYLKSKEWETLNCDINLDSYNISIDNLECNVDDEYDLSNIGFNYYRYGVVFNFVSLADIEECLINPKEAVEVNINGTVNILEQIRKIKFKQKPLFVLASSMYIHNDISGMYGITKRACEEIVKFYSKQYRIPYLILRYGTIYGPRAGENNSIKKIVKEALQTKKISYYGTGEEVREYIHVKDVAKMTIELVEDEKYRNSTYEITGTHPTKAKDMVKMLRDILGKEYKEEFRKEEVFNHYDITPYAFQPDVSKKYVSDTYYSFGAGLLEVVKDENESILDK